MQAATADKAGKKPTARSRVSNGNSLGEMDGRSKWARRLRDLIELYSADIAAADDELTNMQRSLVRRAATMTVELERAEDGFAEAGAADEKALAAYQTTCNTLRRTLETLGLKAKLKDAEEVERDLEGRRVTASVTAGFTQVEWALCIGQEEAAAMRPNGERYDMARRIAFAITEAVEKGKPLPPAIAAFAEESGLIKRVEPLQEADPA